MKTQKILLLFFVLVEVTALLPTTYGYSSLSLTVYTDKPSYQVDEEIEVYGNLTYNGSPIQGRPVALEVLNPRQDPVVTRTLQTNASGSYNATFKLPSDAKLGTYKVYVSSSYQTKTAASNTTFKLVQIIQSTIKIGDQSYTITIESNATITNATTTDNALYFISSGPAGETAYVNTTFPIGLNQTKIKVFIDNTQLVPPPFPVITSNTTHYFIYFEFTLSIHEVKIEFAPVLLLRGPYYTWWGAEYWIVELIEGKAARVVSNYY